MEQNMIELVRWMFNGTWLLVLLVLVGRFVLAAAKGQREHKLMELQIGHVAMERMAKKTEPVLDDR